MRFLLRTEVNFYYWKEWRWIFKLVSREWEKSHQKHSRNIQSPSKPISIHLISIVEPTTRWQRGIHSPFFFEDCQRRLIRSFSLLFSRPYWRAPRKTVNLRELLHFTLAALGSAPQWGHSWPGKVDNWRRPSFAPQSEIPKPAKFFSTSEQERKTGREKRNLKLISSGWRFSKNVKMSKTEKNEIPMETRERAAIFCHRDEFIVKFLLRLERRRLVERQSSEMLQTIYFTSTFVDGATMTEKLREKSVGSSTRKKKNTT